ncbi:uncharacterized protein HD556DRAFT_1303362 [Suillus plorans]|uniref:Uncharacterized protein n=1 Tax=Suillus plorans TaxID=116603 RepID=A0A9P7DWQ7_9AGAM|nr:uncharacterized protein HD556DRAFT_1303362 [Suillus plorans]KAG1804789.1 hypothetical protein HD556DRAFT_1303362 [Suillus plorans]
MASPHRESTIHSICIDYRSVYPETLRKFLLAASGMHRYWDDNINDTGHAISRNRTYTQPQEGVSLTRSLLKALVGTIQHVAVSWFPVLRVGEVLLRTPGHSGRRKSRARARIISSREDSSDTYINLREELMAIRDSEDGKSHGNLRISSRSLIAAATTLNIGHTETDSMAKTGKKSNRGWWWDHFVEHPGYAAKESASMVSEMHREMKLQLQALVLSAGTVMRKQSPLKQWMTWMLHWQEAANESSAASRGKG